MKLTLIPIFVCFLTIWAQAQPGSLDYSFNTQPNTNKNIWDIVVQRDGKIIVGGQQQQGLTNGINRLNPDGSTDPSFFEDGSTCIVLTMFLHADNKIQIAGNFSSYDGVAVENIARLLPDGHLDTTFNTGGTGATGTSAEIRIMLPLPDGKILIAGRFSQYNGVNCGGIARLHPDGSLDTSFHSEIGLGGTLPLVEDMCLQADGKILIGGAFTSYNGTPCPYLARLHSDGSLDPSFSIGTGPNTYVHALAVQPDGKILVGGGNFNSFNGVPVSRFVRLLPDGSIDPTLTHAPPNNGVYSILALPDGKMLLGSLTVSRIHPDGSVDSSFQTAMVSSQIQTLEMQNDGRILVGGWFLSVNGVAREYVARLNGEEGVYGRIFNDIDGDCQQDVDEQGLRNRSLLILPNQIVAQTDEQGAWFVPHLPAGTYTAVVDTGALWSSTCHGVQSFTVIHPDSLTLVPAVGLVADYPCPAPHVSIFMPTMRPCFDEQRIHVQACNLHEGTGTLDSAYVEVFLDSLIQVDSASVPYIALGGNAFRFWVGDINPGQCSELLLYTTLSCDAVVGETRCMEAHLYPQPACVLDSLVGSLNGCTTAWDSSDLSVQGYCQNDSVYFVITNVGTGDATCPSAVRLFVNGVWTMSSFAGLISGGTAVYGYLSQGETFRMEVDQHPLHPGNSQPQAIVEHCNSDSLWIPGMVNAQPLDDADPVIDIYCGEIRAAYDPNDKRGFPSGVTEDHFIAANQALEYVIRFQNTGTDTAFTVVVRDTLPEELDIFTVVSGVASHPYSFRMYGERILEWSFYSILLPDSSSNEPESHGFINFRVMQQPDLPEGTQIVNSADIYFDFNAPVQTHQAWHTIHHFQQIIHPAVQHLSDEELRLSVYPNPASGVFWVECDALSSAATLVLTDVLGRAVYQATLEAGCTSHQISVSQYSAGLYLLQLSKPNALETVKVILK